MHLLFIKHPNKIKFDINKTYLDNNNPKMQQ